MSRWRCVVCDYIHEGEGPPEICPRCGVDASLFVRVESPLRELVREFREIVVPHVVLSHFPAALLPVAALFLALAMIFDDPFFEKAAYAMLCLSALSVPAVWFTGFSDWRRLYRAKIAPVFQLKKALGLLLVALCWVAVVWRFFDTDLWYEVLWKKSLYGLLIMALVALVTLLGHYGAKIVHLWPTEKGKK